MYYGKLLTIFSKNILQKRKENFKEKLKKSFYLTGEKSENLSLFFEKWLFNPTCFVVDFIQDLNKLYRLKKINIIILWKKIK